MHVEQMHSDSKFIYVACAHCYCTGGREVPSIPCLVGGKCELLLEISLLSHQNCTGQRGLQAQERHEKDLVATFESRTVKGHDNRPGKKLGKLAQRDPVQQKLLDTSDPGGMGHETTRRLCPHLIRRVLLLTPVASGSSKYQKNARLTIASFRQAQPHPPV